MASFVRIAVYVLATLATFSPSVSLGQALPVYLLAMIAIKLEFCLPDDKE